MTIFDLKCRWYEEAHAFASLSIATPLNSKQDLYLGAQRHRNRVSSSHEGKKKKKQDLLPKGDCNGNCALLPALFSSYLLACHILCCHFPKLPVCCFMPAFHCGKYPTFGCFRNFPCGLGFGNMFPLQQLCDCTLAGVVRSLVFLCLVTFWQRHEAFLWSPL